MSTLDKKTIRRIGVLGGGQLGRMLGLAALPLGFELKFFDPNGASPAQAVGPLTTAEYSDHKTLLEFARSCDLVTYEFENVEAVAAEMIAKQATLQPAVKALLVAQDRFAEKAFFQKHAIPTAEFREVPKGSLDGNIFDHLLRTLEAPFLLKTRRLGYDGKGQLRITGPADGKKAGELTEAHDVIAERVVSFTRELSIIAVRSRSGEIGFYPLVENVHRGGILRVSRAPAANVSQQLQASAEEYARKILTALDYVGVLTVEFFEVNGKLLANEIAPRVHNSGHWTIEGAETSQFENHLRAVAGLPLGSCQVRGFPLMLNLIGCEPAIEKILSIKNAHFHWYGKEVKPGRKVGHITVVCGSESERAAVESSVGWVLEQHT